MAYVGFPTRPTRTDFGPALKNRKPVRNPEYEVDAQLLGGMLFGQVAGMGMTAFLAFLIVKIQSTGTTAAVLDRWEAWNPDRKTAAAFAPPLVTRVSAGVVDISYASDLPDWDNVSRPVAFKGGLAAYLDDNTNIYVARVIPQTPNNSVVRVRGHQLVGAAQTALDGTFLVGLQ